jgi:PAS domain S-box-containing protein
MIEDGEAKRLAALARWEVLDTPSESELDDLAELAALTFGAPIALISLIDSDRQWFKAHVGLALEETPREIAFCDHAVRSDAVMVVPDALRDVRFRENPLVTGDPGIRFYAGAPLKTADGYRVGTICVMDLEPRETFTPAEQSRLNAIGSSVVRVLDKRADALKSRRLERDAEKTGELLAMAERYAGIGTWVLDVATRKLTWSTVTYRIFGFDPAQPAPSASDFMATYAPDDAANLSRLIDDAIRRGMGYQFEAPVTRADGSVRYISARCLPQSDETGKVVALYGTAQDITELNLADTALRASEARLRTQNWALTAYGRSTSALLHRSGSGGVMTSVCEAIVAHDTYLLAAVALAEPPPSSWLKIAAKAGRAVGYAEDLRLSGSASEPAGLGPTGMAIRSRRPVMMRDSLIDPAYASWRAKGLAHGIRSSVTVPFFRGDTLLGVLLVYADRPDAFGDQEVELFQRLGDELALAMALDDDRARLDEARAGQRQAEEAEREALRRLKASEEHFRLLAENSLDVIVRYGLDGTIEYVSPSVSTLGYVPEELVGQPASTFTVSDDPVGNDSALKALLEGRPLPQGQLNEGRFKCKDGTLVWMQGNPAPVRDDTGKLIGVTTVLRDITDRRAMEEELRRKKKDAEAAAVVKTQFLANMSHEIRTPLTGVIGFARLLDDLDDLPGAARTYIERIIAGGQTLLTIVNEVLDFSRLEAGRLELDPQAFDLAPFLEETLGLVSAEAARKGLALKLEIAEPKPARLTADSGRLRQVLLNLLGNAIKFTPAGSVTVNIAHETDLGGRLRVRVTDTGPGISGEHLDRLFQRFSQIDGSNSREHGGTGLGLSISKGLVEMMGGEIGVDSRPGQGASFWFTVAAPISEPAMAAEPPPDEDWERGPLKVLVVDDVAVNRELIKAMLAPFDLDLSEASNGADAVDAALRHSYDLILMDLQMPGMDGLAATRAIRANCEPNRSTPILAVSANVLPAQVEACLRAGMNDHIGKPIDPRDLLSKIAAWTQ